MKKSRGYHKPMAMAWCAMRDGWKQSRVDRIDSGRSLIAVLRAKGCETTVKSKGYIKIEK